ncbi:MAG: bifunctional UDP-3-O-[3-hydroxymyristoyl] N-acetylglucosamine deacetylase/3-hydroxyacyl-ACP dehydratase [Crocinitomicaceae bacterium TMED135]|nr:MAG: bifunctional UDP-3-O-[3-hydroxymyristoyl] N-acetylglucosamine deacetylase/3-hydroxyacyl-ACP dehydratase [Crocinitomicaceae bacterium TMED135]
MGNNQKTLKESIEFNGLGLHTGKKVCLVIIPARENHGIKFQRIDLPGAPIVPADIDLVKDTQRSTTLELNNVKIITVEHLMSALYALGVNNVLVKMNNSEVPILDGSAKIFVDEIQKVGLKDQNAPLKFINLPNPINYSDFESGAEILFVPANNFILSVVLDYQNPVLGTQYAEIRNLENYPEEIAPCKTFVLLTELEKLAQANLIKGGDLQNAIVLVDRDEIKIQEIKKLAHLLGKDDTDIQVNGNVLNNCELQFFNEPARHKLLDVIGDLALIGMPIMGHIITKKPGHKLNTSFAQILKKAMKEQEKSPRKFDLSKKPLYDIVAIEKMLPHRYPFLLIDKIMEITDNGIIGVKNVTMNENFFMGHFPNNPVMPGVLQIEAMAQTGGIFSLSKVKEPHLYSTYFMKIDNVKFKKKVIPGDTVVFDLNLISPIRRGLVHMRGKGYVNGVICIEAEMLAQVVKDREE